MGDLPPGVTLFEGRALASPLRLLVHDPVAPARGTRALRPATAWAEVVDEFAAVDRALSRFRDDSELTALNRAAGSGRRLVVSRRLRSALAAADRARRVTAGRFDARVLGALEELGDRGAAIGAPDAAGAPAPAARRRPLLAAPDRPLDLGGIGKGLALRWAAARAAGVLGEGAGLLLEAGGDLVARGRAPAAGWPVGIEDPSGGPDPVAVVVLRDGALATSSVRLRAWIAPDGRAVHHLLDPRDGRPAATGLAAVSVAGPDPAWAEVWTKALFLAGRAAIADEARGRGLAAWWVTTDGMLGMTPAARAATTWASEARLG